MTLMIDARQAPVAFLGPDLFLRPSRVAAFRNRVHRSLLNTWFPCLTSLRYPNYGDDAPQMYIQLRLVPPVVRRRCLLTQSSRIRLLRNNFTRRHFNIKRWKDGSGPLDVMLHVACGFSGPAIITPPSNFLPVG